MRSFVLGLFPDTPLSQVYLTPPSLLPLPLMRKGSDAYCHSRTKDKTEWNLLAAVSIQQHKAFVAVIIISHYLM